MSRWFRWYQGTCEDGKFRMIARNAEVTVATVMGVWAVLLEDASHLDHRGIAVRGHDFYAAILDMSDGDVLHVLQFMEQIGLISIGHGAITVSKWKERQFETDAVDNTNAERQRRWREKHKSNVVKTENNGSVTEAKRPDTDTDTEKKEHCPVAKATRTVVTYSEDFEQNFWKPFPRTSIMSKKEAWREWMKLAPDQRLASCQAIEPYKRHLAKNPTLHAVHACRFISQNRAEGILELAAEKPKFDVRAHLA